MSKATAIDMCMKHKGLYAADKQDETKVILDLDSFFEQRKPEVIDGVVKRLEEEEQNG